MAKFDGIRGQELLDVEEQKDGSTLIFKDNRFFVYQNRKWKIGLRFMHQNSMISKTPLTTTSNLVILLPLVELFGYYK